MSITINTAAAATRSDARYVGSDDPHAVLVAWGGSELTLDMGGWLDGDIDAFDAAVRDEAAYGLGLSAEEAAAFRVSIKNSGTVQKLVNDAIEGIIDNELTNDVGSLDGWGAAFAVRLYAGLEGGDEPKFVPSAAQISEAANDVGEFLLAVQKAVREALEDDAEALADYGWNGGDRDEYADFWMEGATDLHATKIRRRFGVQVNGLVRSLIRAGFNPSVHNPA